MPLPEEARTGVMPPVPLANAIFFVPMFHGDGKEGGVTVEDFLESLAFVRNMKIATDTELLQLAAIRMYGTAKNYLRAHPELVEGGNYERFRQALKERFGPTRDRARLMNSLLSVIQRPGEGVREYTQRVEYLLDEICRRGTDGSEIPPEIQDNYKNELGKVSYTRGLIATIRQEVLVKGPKNFAEAAKFAREAERNLELCCPPSQGSAKAGDPLMETVRCIEEDLIERLIRVLKAEQPPITKGSDETEGSKVPPGTNDIECWACGRKGHFSRQCPCPSPRGNVGLPVTCFVCGQLGHFARNCPFEGAVSGRIDIYRRSPQRGGWLIPQGVYRRGRGVIVDRGTRGGYRGRRGGFDRIPSDRYRPSGGSQRGNQWRNATWHGPPPRTQVDNRDPQQNSPYFPAQGSRQSGSAPKNGIGPPRA